MSNRFFTIVAIIGVAVGLIAVFGSGGSEKETGAAQSTAAPAAIPRVSVPAVTLPRADGGTFSTAALRGKSPVIISFFATWCGPCREELPHLIELYNKHRAAGLKVAYITSEDADTARGFAKQMALPFPVLIDADHSVGDRFQADSIPTTVLLDKQGRAAGESQGYSPDLFAQIEALTAQLLKE